MRIEEITVFLRVLKSLKSTDKYTFFGLVESAVSFLPLRINYDLIFNLCKRLKLFQQRNRRVVITDLGLDIIDMQEKKIDLTNEQKNFIANNCVFDNPNFNELNEFFRSIPYNSQLKKFGFEIDELSPKVNQNLTKLPKSDFSILTQLEILEKKSNFWVVAKDYQPKLEIRKKSNRKQMTEQQLEKILNEQKRIGNLAEEFSINYEKEELKKKGWKWQADHIKQISKDFVNAGYDIESFFSKNQKRDKLIEVKGRKRRTNSFIISANEIQVAAETGKDYFIYFWNNLGSKEPPKTPTRIIRNPHKELSFGKCKNCLQYLIELD